VGISATLREELSGTQRRFTYKKRVRRTCHHKLSLREGLRSFITEKKITRQPLPISSHRCCGKKDTVLLNPRKMSFSKNKSQLVLRAKTAMR